VTFQGTGFENRLSGGVSTKFSLQVFATIRYLTVNVSLRGRRGTRMNSKHKGGGCLLSDYFTDHV
jgi:hypothetical protein